MVAALPARSATVVDSHRRPAWQPEMIVIAPASIAAATTSSAPDLAAQAMRLRYCVSDATPAPMPLIGHFDFIWCRDVVEQVDDLDGALHEAARVLKPDGRMLVYTTFATDRLNPQEAGMVNRHLGNVPANLVERNVEDAVARAGLSIERKDVIGTEWREHLEERTKPASALYSGSRACDGSKTRSLRRSGATSTTTSRRTSTGRCFSSSASSSPQRTSARERQACLVAQLAPTNP